MDYETRGVIITDEEDIPSGIQTPCPKCGGDLEYLHGYGADYVCGRCNKTYGSFDNVKLFRMEKEMDIINKMCDRGEGVLSKIFNELRDVIPLPHIGALYSDIHLMEVKGWISEYGNTLYVEKRNI